MDEQRKQFEEWIYNKALMPIDSVEGRYVHSGVQRRWEAWQAAQEAAKPKWKIMCGDWRDELVSIHGENGLIVSGLTMDQAQKIVDAHGGKDTDSASCIQQ